MICKSLIGTTLFLALSGAAMAGHCPLDAKAIDSALMRSTLSAADKAKVESLREKGMGLHMAGDHRQSEKVLAEAMRVLLSGGLD